MGAIKDIYQNALLAQASYARFDVDDGFTIYAPELLQLIVQNNSGGDKAEFSAAQAENFAGPQGYTLLSFTSDPSTGLEAALFESRSEPGQYTLAIRGTAGPLDIVGADIFGIVAQGQAAAQSVSLYRYYKRLITPRGAAVEYSQAEIEMLAAVTNRKYDAYGAADLRGSREFQQTVAGLAAKLAVDTGLGRLNPDSRIDVTGHSLGGHLAQAFGALFFPDRVDHIYTYNGAGLGGSVYKAAKKFLGDRGIDLGAKSTNIVAEDGLTLGAGFGYKFGPIQKLAIEPGVLWDNHSIANSTDALAIYDLLGQMSPDLSLDTFNKIVRDATNSAKSGYEATLDIVRRIILGPDIQATPPSFRDEPAARDELYKNIDDLKKSAGFKEFVGAGGRPYSVASLIDALNPAGLATDDTDGIAYRYALKNLNPFAIVGLDYAEFNRDGELDLYSSSTGQGTITSAWLQDRAQFLLWKNQKNLYDIADGVSILRKDNGVASYLFTDKALKDAQGQDYSIRVMGGNALQQIDPIRISFASDQGDSLQGGNYADHLYGGKGMDTLTGGGGDDYLEGGASDDSLSGEAGDDKLVGGKGVDTLIGGAGDDILDGGRDNDLLQGGADNDTYMIRAGDGRDTILDHEGRNTIVYEDAGGQRTVLALSAFAVAGVANTWRGSLAGGGTVEITRNSPLTAMLPDGTQFIVDDYQDGDCGINLQEHRDDPIATREIYGDLWPIPIFEESGNFYYNYDDLGNVVVDPGHSAVGAWDNIWGSEGNDFISTGEGRDVVLAMGGDDWIRAGGSDDYLDGGDGDDVIEGRFTLLDANQEPNIESMFEGGNGNDRLYADEVVELSQDLIDLGIGEEWEGNVGLTLSGGRGDDILVGSNYMDQLHGGLGKDFIAGRGGRDVILGDFALEPTGPVPRDQVAQEPDFPFFPYGNFPRELAEGDDDVIFGGTGNDEIWGQGGDDWISGGEGNDFIVGGRGSDVLLGGAGNDTIFAGGRYGDFLPSDRDVLDGGDGNDTLNSTSGDDIFLGGAGDDKISCGSGDNLAYGGDGNDQIRTSGSGRNEFYGEAGNDSLIGGSGDDYLDGGDGDDVLIGNAGADTMLGGAGNDFLEAYQGDLVQGGEGNDTYQFRLGAGTNTVVDDLGSNQLVIFSLEYSDSLSERPLEPVSRDSIQLYVEGDRYRIAYGDRGDEIVLGSADFAALTGLTLRHMVGYHIEYLPGSDEPQRVENYDDEMPPLSQLAPHYLGYGDGDYLIGNDGVENTLDGKDGDDFLIGGSRDDTLIGGVGNDVLDGGDGSDRYVFNPDDGVDAIFDSGTQGADTLAFGQGIDPDSLTLDVAGALLIRIGDTGDAVYVDGFDPDNASAAGAIERYEFADGTILSQAQLISRGFDLYGTDSDELIFGTSAADRFHASSGDDIMVGGAGDDIYYFGFASGHDSIVDQDTTPDNVDTIVLGNGIAPENLSVLSSPGLLSLAIGMGDRLDIQWRPQDGSAIERVRFADGTIWDSAALAAHAVPVVLTDLPGNSDGGSGAPAESNTPIVVSLESPNMEAPGLAGSGTSSVNDVAQYDAAAIDALRNRIADIRAGIAPPAASTPIGAAAGPGFDSGTSSNWAGGAPALDLPHPGVIPSTPVSGDSASKTAGLLTTAAQDTQNALLSALSRSGQFDSLSAPTPRSDIKLLDLSSAPPGSGPAGFSSGADSLFGALRPTQPSMQAWLDDWLGPRARANAAAREGTAPADIEDVPPPPMEEFSPQNPQDHIPETQPAEALTPEEIAQRYENIASWLADHPGIEQGSAMASGSAAQRNLFAFVGAGTVGDGGFGSVGVFGQTPGMAAIGGNALQPLRGISEGYPALGVV